MKIDFDVELSECEYCDHPETKMIYMRKFSFYLYQTNLNKKKIQVVNITKNDTGDKNIFF